MFFTSTFHLVPCLALFSTSLDTAIFGGGGGTVSSARDGPSSSTS